MAHRPECYCLSRHVLTAPSFSARGIMICISRNSRLWLVDRFRFGNTRVASRFLLLSIKRLDAWTEIPRRDVDNKGALVKGGPRIELKSWARFNFYVYARLFTHRRYFIYAGKANSNLRPCARENYATVEIHRTSSHAATSFNLSQRTSNGQNVIRSLHRIRLLILV